MPSNFLYQSLSHFLLMLQKYLNSEFNLPFSNSINLPIPFLKWWSVFFKMMNGLTRQETWWDLPISHPFRLSLDLIAHYLSFLSRQTSLKFLLIDSSHENLHLGFKMCPNVASIHFLKARCNLSLIILDCVKLLAFYEHF